MNSILEIEGLKMRFGGLTAVNNLSFFVKEGEILGFIGPNGAGKTTVFNLIMGVLRPDSGRIRFKETDITGWRTYRVVNAGISRAFQSAQVYPHKTVYENIEISTIPNSIFSLENRGARQEKVLRVSEMVGLTAELGKLPGSLPHASLRQLEIAKAVATDPDLLLLDEPFAGLSATEVKEISVVISNLRRAGKTAIVVDHNMKGLMRLVDTVVVISFGEKLAEGVPEEVVQNRDVQEAYLAGGSSASI